MISILCLFALFCTSSETQESCNGEDEACTIRCRSRATSAAEQLEESSSCSLEDDQLADLQMSGQVPIDKGLLGLSMEHVGSSADMGTGGAGGDAASEARGAASLKLLKAHCQKLLDELALKTQQRLAKYTGFVTVAQEEDAKIGDSHMASAEILSRRMAALRLLDLYKKFETLRNLKRLEKRYVRGNFVYIEQVIYVFDHLLSERTHAYLGRTQTLMARHFSAQANEFDRVRRRLVSMEGLFKRFERTFLQKTHIDATRAYYAIRMAFGAVRTAGLELPAGVLGRCESKMLNSVSVHSTAIAKQFCLITEAIRGEADSYTRTITQATLAILGMKQDMENEKAEFVFLRKYMVKVGKAADCKGFINALGPLVRSLARAYEPKVKHMMQLPNVATDSILDPLGREDIVVHAPIYSLVCLVHAEYRGISDYGFFDYYRPLCMYENGAVMAIPPLVMASRYPPEKSYLISTMQAFYFVFQICMFYLGLCMFFAMLILFAIVGAKVYVFLRTGCLVCL